MTATKYGMGLSPRHATMLEESAISPEVAHERGYVTVTEKAMLERYGFSRSQRRVPGLMIPWWSGNEIVGYQYRPDVPREIAGRPVKYETRQGQNARVDVHPRLADKILDPAVTLWITEGARKADAAVSIGLCCVALSGVWNWRGRNEQGGTSALADWDSIALKDREVILAFDSDSGTKRSVYAALARLKSFLENRGANVNVLHLPDADNGDKVGLDDFIAATAPDELKGRFMALVDSSLGHRPEEPIDAPVGADGHHLTETGNAERLIALHGERLRYVARWGSWLTFTEGFWREDHRGVQVLELAKDVARTMWRNVEGMPSGTPRNRNAAWAKTSEKSGSLNAMVHLARGIPGVLVGHDDLDADPWLLGVVNGVVDLRAVELTEHDPERLITRCAGTYWDVSAQAPRWLEFLERILPDNDVRNFVQRAVGYTLSGSTGEQVMFLPIGEGANGKSTFIEVVLALLGDYAGIIAKDLLIAQRNEAHPTSAADLFRLRFAAAVETEATNSFAEARVKQLTGGDKIKARRMREDFWSFTPTHKLWLAANHLPRIKGTDAAIWRRIRVIPFGVTIPADERDPHLLDALIAELPGILQWAVDGCWRWQSEGLAPPASVLAATDAYRAESDTFTAMLDDTGLQLGEQFRILTSELTKIYRDWASANGEDPLTRQAFAKELRRRGCTDLRVNSARLWRGIGRPQPAE